MSCTEGICGIGEGRVGFRRRVVVLFDDVPQGGGDGEAPSCRDYPARRMVSPINALSKDWPTAVEAQARAFVPTISPHWVITTLCLAPRLEYLRC
jgi:hypothetical protein